MVTAKKYQSLNISGMTCANCAKGIEKHLTKIGIKEVKVDFANAEAHFLSKKFSFLNNDLENIDTLQNIGSYKQKIALIPFANLNKDEDGAFLVDGIVEDLITEFSMIKEIEILSRQSCFDFREKNYSTEEFKKEMNILIANKQKEMTEGMAKCQENVKAAVDGKFNENISVKKIYLIFKMKLLEKLLYLL